VVSPEPAQSVAARPRRFVERHETLTVLVFGTPLLFRTIMVLEQQIELKRPDLRGALADLAVACAVLALITIVHRGSRLAAAVLAAGWVLTCALADGWLRATGTMPRPEQIEWLRAAGGLQVRGPAVLIAGAVVVAAVTFVCRPDGGFARRVAPALAMAIVFGGAARLLATSGSAMEWRQRTTLVEIVAGAVRPAAALRDAGPVPPPATPPLEPLIAHAGGGLNGQIYTNLREAFDLAYANGFRLLETDLQWTSDEHLVLLHDWNETWQALVGLPPGRRGFAAFTRAEVIEGGTPMTIDDLADWTSGHPGAWIVSDAKTGNLAALRRIRARRPDLAARVVPQIYHPRELAPVVAMGYEHVILTLYRWSEASDDEVVAFAADHDLFAVTMPWDQALEGDLVRRLRDAGRIVYVHPVNDPALAERLRAAGVHGVYTSFLTPGPAGEG
jgi:glycerophosphoryl diester phosphodiesterase